MKLTEDQKTRFRDLLEKLLYKRIQSVDYYDVIGEFENLLSRIKLVVELRHLLTEEDIDSLAKEFTGNSLDRKKRKKIDVQVHKAWSFINKTYLAFKHDNRCEICRGREILQIHHKTYSKGKRLEHYNQFMYLCKECHMEEHRNMRKASKKLEGVSEASNQSLKKVEKADKETEEISNQENRASKKKKPISINHPVKKVPVDPKPTNGQWRYKGKCHKKAKQLVQHIKQIILEDQKFTFQKYVAEGQVTTVSFLDNAENILVHIIVPINSDEHYVEKGEYPEVQTNSEFLGQSMSKKDRQSETKKLSAGEKMRLRIEKISNSKKRSSTNATSL